ncbi:Stk1 family PASTA domain-containing Ser/Thr kinase [Intrasporangium sp.]|uniref:Stk1 family PASTA domain-containing Ser/Thr kinase n=1 Tax=Intrasporangium sp. TaxID=1925024 RepID=UPI0033657C4E
MLANRYELESRIAAGGMGEVHVAMDTRLHRRVAVKLLREELADSGDFVERFRREALMSARLTHPSVARILDYGQDGATHFIVMELVEGRDLAKVLAERGRIPAQEAARMTAQVCDALGAAHEAGFVHRDIKPSNVIITPQGAVKVTDFGIARALGGSSLTETGTIMGTAQYVSPEMVRGEPANEASDQYSVGVLLFQMLTGSVPFDGDSPVTVALRHLDSEVPRPSSLAPDLPIALDEVVARATAMDPRDRFPDVGAMAAALRQVATARPSHSAPTAALSQPAQHSATSVLPAATHALASPRAAVPHDRAEATRAAQRSRTEGTSHSGRSRVRWVVATLAAVAIAAAATLALNRGDEPVNQPVASPTTTSQEQPTSQEPDTPEGPAMPRDAVGRERADVVEDLKARGLRVWWVLVRSGAPEGQVIGTFPKQGEVMDRGQTAVLVVSRGQLPGGVEPVVVPEGLAGATADDATTILKRASLRYSTAPIPSAEAPGTVVGSWPASGEPASDGVVVLVVSAGASRDSGNSGNSGNSGDSGNGTGNDKKGKKKPDNQND